MPTPFSSLAATTIFKRYVPFGPFIGWHLYFDTAGELPTGITLCELSGEQHAKDEEGRAVRQTQLAERLTQLWNNQVHAERHMIACCFLEAFDEEHIGDPRVVGPTTDTYLHKAYVHQLMPHIGALLQKGWDATPESIANLVQGEQAEVAASMEEFGDTYLALNYVLENIFETGFFPRDIAPGKVEHAYLEYVTEKARQSVPPVTEGCPQEMHGIQDLVGGVCTRCGAKVQ